MEKAGEPLASRPAVKNGSAPAAGTGGHHGQSAARGDADARDDETNNSSCATRSNADGIGCTWPDRRGIAQNDEKDSDSMSLKFRERPSYAEPHKDRCEQEHCETVTSKSERVHVRAGSCVQGETRHPPAAPAAAANNEVGAPTCMRPNACALFTIICSIC